jgi:hypothetical protein
MRDILQAGTRKIQNPLKSNLSQKSFHLGRVAMPSRRFEKSIKLGLRLVRSNLPETFPVADCEIQQKEWTRAHQLTRNRDSALEQLLGKAGYDGGDPKRCPQYSQHPRRALLSQQVFRRTIYAFLPTCGIFHTIQGLKNLQRGEGHRKRDSDQGSARVPRLSKHR